MWEFLCVDLRWTAERCPPPPSVAWIGSSNPTNPKGNTAGLDDGWKEGFSSYFLTTEQVRLWCMFVDSRSQSCACGRRDVPAGDGMRSSLLWGVGPRVLNKGVKRWTRSAQVFLAFCQSSALHPQPHIQTMICYLWASFFWWSFKSLAHFLPSFVPFPTNCLIPPFLHPFSSSFSPGPHPRVPLCAPSLFMANILQINFTTTEGNVRMRRMEASWAERLKGFLFLECVNGLFQHVESKKTKYKSH